MARTPALLDEEQRLMSLYMLGLLDTPAEERFDRITRMAARVFDVPIALISLVDAERQWLKSAYGFAVAEIEHENSFCTHAILQDDQFIIPDILLDQRFANHPFVVGEPYARFYAGQPFHAPDGERVGVLCLLDRRPRAFAENERASLRDLAAWVEHELHAVRLHEVLDLLRVSESRYRSVIAALHDSRERYRNLVDSAQDIVFTLDPHGALTSLNPAFETTLGWSRAALLGNSYAPLVHPDDVELATLMLQRVLNGEKPAAFELRILTRDGKYICAESTIAPQTVRGAVVGVLGIARDITNRRQSEEALRASEARNRALVDAIPDLMFRLNRAGVYRDFRADRAGDAALPPGGAIGRSIFDHLAEPLARQIEAVVEQTLATGEMHVLEYELSPERGARDFEARFVVCDAGEVLALVRDITDRKNVERLKNEFVSTVSHELRTPLTSIFGSLGLLAGGVAGELPNMARSMIDIAHKNSERLVRLINDILDIDKIESGKMVFDAKIADLAPIIAHTVEANRGYSRQFGVQFEIDNQALDARVHVDADRLIQALTNLLSNAAKCSPPSEPVLISVRREGHYIRIAVADRGPGIPEEFQERMFQKFAQADSADMRRPVGTGLGLTITKAIVEKLGGRISYQTKIGYGTTFFLDLPEARASASQSHTTGHEPPRILLFDDSQAGAALRTLLQQHGLVIDLASSADDARQLLSEKSYTAMILDLELPYQEGIALIHSLRRRSVTPDLPVIGISTRSRLDEQALCGTVLAVVDCYEQPLDRHRLLATMGGTSVGRPRILHVDDDPDVCQFVATMMHDAADVTAAATLHAAHTLLRTNTYNLIILDIELPDGNGLELVSTVERASAGATPIVVLSAYALGDEQRPAFAAALVKSHTTKEALLETIVAQLARVALEPSEPAPHNHMGDRM